MSDKLTDPRVAEIMVGFDADFTFFKVYTRILTNDAGESGQFHFDYKNYFPALEKSVDPAGFLKAAARIMLAHAVRTTGVPVEKWIIEFSPVMERFKVPSHLFLDTMRDRTWLA